jgi:hypothetical protein
MHARTRRRAHARTRAGADFELAPAIGDMVVFAPWIEHAAAPTRCGHDDARVSFSFNLQVRSAGPLVCFSAVVDAICA